MQNGHCKFVCVFVGELVFPNGYVVFKHRIGGVRTLLIGSASMAVMLLAFAFTTSYAGLFVAALLFGLGFSGIMPCYPLIIRLLFPVSEAGWRIAGHYLFSAAGMALGGWLGGVIFDLTGDYSPAFLVGFAFTVMNFILIAVVYARQTRLGLNPLAA